MDVEKMQEVMKRNVDKIRKPLEEFRKEVNDAGCRLEITTAADGRYQFAILSEENSTRV